MVRKGRGETEIDLGDSHEYVFPTQNRRRWQSVVCTVTVKTGSTDKQRNAVPDDMPRKSRIQNDFVAFSRILGRISRVYLSIKNETKIEF